jgi:N-acetylmuramoyl-L-alanine amidase
MKTVLIDAGHGLIKGGDGKWHYQRESIFGYREDHGTQDMAYNLAISLAFLGINVLTTRPVKYTPEYDEIGRSGYPMGYQGALDYVRRNLDGHPLYKEVCRTEKGNDISCRSIYANIMEVDFAISLHSNAASDLEPHGIEVWYNQATPLCNQVRTLAYQVYHDLIKVTPILNGGRGVKGGSLDEEIQAGKWAWFRLMNNKIPAILLEYGFHTNDTDREILQDSEHIKAGMFELASTISGFLENTERESLV